LDIEGEVVLVLDEIVDFQTNGVRASNEVRSSETASDGYVSLGGHFFWFSYWAEVVSRNSKIE
jgi:hypothetical protein